MKRPHLRHFAARAASVQDWTLCGSLCTTNDVLVRSMPLAGLCPGDLLVFENTGAYSVTEGLGLFLSRDLPQVILWQNARRTRYAAKRRLSHQYTRSVR